MKLEGRCYCGAIRYVAEGEPRGRAQCHCRECQYFTGGGPNYFLMMPAESVRYTQGTPKRFARTDLERPVTREFCGTCGTQLMSRPSGLPIAIIKAGTLDQPALLGTPQMAIFAIDKQPFHVIAEGVPVFERVPG